MKSYTFRLKVSIESAVDTEYFAQWKVTGFPRYALGLLKIPAMVFVEN